jgi:hypothetical protein
MGLTAVHSDIDTLISIMSRLMFRQLQFALENENPSDIFHPAPDDVWKRFREAVAQSQDLPTKIEKPIHAGLWQTMNEISAWQGTTGPSHALAAI